RVGRTRARRRDLAARSFDATVAVPLVSSGWHLARLLALSTLIGGPIVAILWETLNQLLAGIVRPRMLAIAVPTLFIAIVLLRVLARAVERLDPRTAAPTDPTQPTGR